MNNVLSAENACVSCFAQNETGNPYCTVCGYSEAAQGIPPHHLRPRTILNGKYLVGKVIGEGGFGITYIGWDLNLAIKVAIKEYYPNGYVTREISTSSNVRPFTGPSADFFEKGRSRFVEEARNLAKFRSLSGIVAVNDFFLENGTAYIAMEYIDGQTVKEYLAKMGGKLPAAAVFDMMKPVMASLANVHQSGIIHRDISPDNIMITGGGEMKLLDFGAAKGFAESGSKSMSIMLKPGFAPEEQYRSKGIQGPWTDVYALCATMYRCITGETPTESNERARGDSLKYPSLLGVGIDRAQEAALMRGLAILQENRWKNVSELYDALYGVRKGTPLQGEKTETAAYTPVKTEKRFGSISRKWMLIASVSGGVALLAVAAAFLFIFALNGGRATNVTDREYTYETAKYTIRCSYTGEWRHNMPNGEGVLTAAEDRKISGNSWLEIGDVIKGTFVDGLLEGQGELVSLNGDRSSGEYRDGLQNGEGRYEWKGGDVYEGEFKDDHITGYGKYSFDDGNGNISVYEGEFVEFVFNGWGYYVYKDSDGDEVVYDGEFKDGAFNGYGEMTCENYIDYKGGFRDGVFDGYGEALFDNGNTYAGEYANGLYNGRGKFTNKSGESWDGNWKDGKMHGEGIYIDEYGDTYDDVYEDGVEISSVPRFDKNSIVGVWSTLDEDTMIYTEYAFNDKMQYYQLCFTMIGDDTETMYPLYYILEGKYSLDGNTIKLDPLYYIHYNDDNNGRYELYENKFGTVWAEVSVKKGVFTMKEGSVSVMYDKDTPVGRWEFGMIDSFAN